MSIASIRIIMGRIATATEASTIAVFGLPEKCGNLDAVFGATVISQRLEKTDQRFIGMFHRKMKMAEVKKRLMSAATA